MLREGSGNPGSIVPALVDLVWFREEDRLGTRVLSREAESMLEVDSEGAGESLGKPGPSK